MANFKDHSDPLESGGTDPFFVDFNGAILEDSWRTVFQHLLTSSKQNLENTFDLRFLWEMAERCGEPFENM